MRIFLIAILFLLSNNVWSQKISGSPLLDSVFNYICEINIQHADIVVKQVILETGWLKSEFLMSKKNLFGFRHKNYIIFKTWKESVDYYKKWQDKYYIDPKEDYYKFLIRIKYATESYPNYLSKIRFNKTCQTE